MRLIRHDADGHSRLAVIVGDRAVDAVDLPSGATVTIESLMVAGTEARARLQTAAQDAAGHGRPISALRLLPPLDRPGKIVAVGRNYREHATEQGVLPPIEPLLFAKFPSAMIGHRAEITWRASDSRQVDYEAELAVVIGRRARGVAAADALDHVFAYTCLTDVSARDIQFSDGQWVRGKSLDTFCPVGPWLVTTDEIPDPQTLVVACEVNGERVQQASTSEMLFPVAELIAFCSRFMTLDPGDVISTGTPPGVGVFRDPPRFLEDGDVVVVEISTIGRLENRCRVIAE
jgi:2-keto-4-pentenoate hydratase/2-oxohepta-3-ene-1,7-dioic acid hydratase in catechol pathway